MERDLIWQHIHEQRAQLAKVLADLSEEEWEAPSLCAGWRVREVAAHVISSPAVGPIELLGMAAKYGGNFNKMTDREARRRARRPVAEILADYAAYDGSRRHPLGTSVLDPLIDVLVHTQDIVVPLGRRHDMPPVAAALALDRAFRVALVFGTHRFSRSHRFTGTDVEWSAGRGEPVTGTAQELLLMLTGRTPGPVGVRRGRRTSR